jgi:hypothetical protein
MSLLWWSCLIQLVGGTLLLREIYRGRRELRQLAKRYPSGRLAAFWFLVTYLACLNVCLIVCFSLQMRVGSLEGMATLSGLLLLYPVFRRRDKQSKAPYTCPNCCASDALVNAYDDEKPPILSRCANFDCDFATYWSPSKLKGRPLVRFPTVSAPSAGTTVYMTALYRELREGCYPEDISLRLVTQTTAYRDKLDLLERGVRLSATSFGDDESLVVSISDNGGFGSLCGLVSVFDKPGHSVPHALELREARHRMADGYLVFVDIAEQWVSLDLQLEQLRIIKDLPFLSRRKKSPIAVCIPKLDLFAERSGVAADSVTRLLDELASAETAFSPWSSSLIQRRFERISEFIGTNWPIHSQFFPAIRRWFHGNLMFFPMSASGLAEKAPDFGSIPGLRMPYGIVEPILWLLEENGFRVLPS